MAVLFAKLGYNAAMKQHSSWKRLARTTVHDTPHLRVHVDTVKLPSGAVIDDYSVVEFNDVVSVVATDAQGNILVLEEYRYATDQTMLNLPAGTIRRGAEDPREAAIRELREETGYVSGNVQQVATFHEFPTKAPHIITVFRAKNIQKVGKTQHEATENIRVTFMTPQQVKDGIFANQFRSAAITAALVCALPELFGAKTDVA